MSATVLGFGTNSAGCLALTGRLLYQFVCFKPETFGVPVFLLGILCLDTGKVLLEGGPTLAHLGRALSISPPDARSSRLSQAFFCPSVEEPAVRLMGVILVQGD